MTIPDRIQPYAANPFYWQYKAKPILLLGGSVEDNLFQIPDIEEHLDLLASVGGNYVRCTMSSRDPGNVWPFERSHKTGHYDLSKPGAEYWRRFERFLSLCVERDIIAQIEVWDRFDFARAPWQQNPYNPRQNSNYSAAESGLPEVIETHPGRRENGFFRSVPALENNETVLRYQRLQVEQMLSLSLRFGNVLYCIDNETNESPEWGMYWARFIQRRAQKESVTVQTTEMWDAHSILADEHRATLDHPEIYSFVDISQNNHRPAHEHWGNPQEIRRRIQESGRIRPVNSVKIYGANTGRYGSTRDAQERFWRNIFGGLASSRFHRPPAGLGLSEIAQAHIRSMRMLTDQFNVFGCEPHMDLLHNRSWNEAYCIANPGVAYAVFFPDGGDVLLDIVPGMDYPLTLRWLDIRHSQWVRGGQQIDLVTEGGKPFARLTTPEEEGYWVALIVTERNQ